MHREGARKGLLAPAGPGGLERLVARISRVRGAGVGVDRRGGERGSAGAAFTPKHHTARAQSRIKTVLNNEILSGAIRYPSGQRFSESQPSDGTVSTMMIGKHRRIVSIAPDNACCS